MRANRSRLRRGEALPVNRNTEDVREAETVLAGLPARMRIQLLIKRTGLKQPYKAGSGTVIRTPDRRKAAIKNTSSGKSKPEQSVIGYVSAIGNSGEQGG